MFETGLAVGRSLGRAGIRVLGLDSSRKVGFYSKYITPRICPEPWEEEDFVAFLLRIADREDLQPVLFITGDEFLAPFIRNRSDVEKRYLVNLPDSQLLECITDKYKQAQLARAVGIPVPETFVVRSLEQLLAVIDRIPLPAFIKGAEAHRCCIEGLRRRRRWIDSGNHSGPRYQPFQGMLLYIADGRGPLEFRTTKASAAAGRLRFWLSRPKCEIPRVAGCWENLPRKDWLSRRCFSGV